MAINLNAAAIRPPRRDGADDALLSRFNGKADGPAAADGAFAGLLAAARESKKPVIDKTDKLYAQCEELEGILLKTLINGMRKTVEKSELTKNSFAGDIYEDMLYDEYSKRFTRNTHFGLAELAYLELTGQRGKLLARA